MYILFFLSTLLSISLAVVMRQLLHSKNEYKISQEKLKGVNARVYELDQKYGQIEIKKDTIQQLNQQISSLSDNLRQINIQSQLEQGELSLKISGLTNQVKQLDEQVEIKEQEIFNKISAATFKIRELEVQENAKQNTIEELNNRVIYLTNKLKEICDQIRKEEQELSSKVTTLTTSIANLQNREMLKEDTAKQIEIKISYLKKEFQSLEEQNKIEGKEIYSKILSLRTELEKLEEQELVESFGFYESKYDFKESADYKQRLDIIRNHQKQIIKDRQAAICNTQWSVEGSVKKGKKMTDDFLKLVLRAFNGECDTSVLKVKYNNVRVMENRIVKTYGDLNKLSQTTHCEITPHFLELKLQELFLTHEYQEKKYQEQEEQRIIREQMREEEKALRELEKVKQDAEREEHRYQEALDKARRDIETTTGQAQAKLLQKIEELQKRLLEAEANKERAISQAQLTKFGHVYIISNIGSFGEDIYKIGMTRRLEPMDRVKELSDASVPFPFDVHAMIFCENAPALESLLHKHFHERRMNKENQRKEFFRVSLDEIVASVREIDKELKTCKSKIIFTKIAEAADYRKTLARERQNSTSR
jgi:Domain of unknown function (DUF4041)/T5orf172 domain